MASMICTAAWRRQKGLCSYCKRPVPVGEATIDHVVPRSKGGGTRGNTVMACWQCNNLKGDMPAPKFRELLNGDPVVLTDRRQRLSDARLQMWHKADVLKAAR